MITICSQFEGLIDYKLNILIIYNMNIENYLVIIDRIGTPTIFASYSSNFKQIY